MSAREGLRGRLPLPTLPLRTWLVTSHLMALFIPILVIVGTGALGAELRNQTRVDLENQGNLVALFVAAEAEDIAGQDLRIVAQRLGPLLLDVRTRTLAAIRLVDASAVVIASSGDGLGDALTDHPEVMSALRGQPAVEVRPRDPPTRNDISSESRRAGIRLFVAVPVTIGGDVRGAVLLSRTPMEEVQALYRLLPWRVAVVAVGSTLLIALVASNRFARSLTLLAEAAQGLASGRREPEGPLQGPAGSRVAEVRSLAHTFSQTASRLRTRLRATAELAGNVAHEFRTPIATLRGTTELLRDDPDMPPPQRERFLGNALHELDRLDRTVGGLLSLARAEEPGSDTCVDLDALAREVAARHDIPVAGAGDTVAGNRSQLDSALDNLATNARRHGGPPFLMRLDVVDGHVRCALVDHGAGVSVANQQRLFERFFTTDRAHGTGLGLALVRAVAEAHGGEVAFASTPGATTFTMTVPCASHHGASP